MQTLLMADEFIPLIKDGSKKITIRKGVRDISLGELNIEAVSSKETLVVDVDVVYSCVFDQIPLKHIIADGGTNHFMMLQSMKNFYPDMDMKTFCTVIQWK